MSNNYWQTFGNNLLVFLETTDAILSSCLISLKFVWILKERWKHFDAFCSSFWSSGKNEYLTNMTFTGWKDARKAEHRKHKEEGWDVWVWTKNSWHGHRCPSSRSTKAASYPHSWIIRRHCDDSIDENATSPSSTIPEYHYFPSASAVGQVWVLTKN